MPTLSIRPPPHKQESKHYFETPKLDMREPHDRLQMYKLVRELPPEVLAWGDVAVRKWIDCQGYEYDSFKVPLMATPPTSDLYNRLMGPILPEGSW